MLCGGDKPMTQRDETIWKRARIAAAFAIALIDVLAPVQARDNAGNEAAALAAASGPAPLTWPAVAYPITRRDPLVEQAFGQSVHDPYRWLEADVRGDPEVARWAAQQNAVSADYLSQLPARDAFAARISALLNYERFSLPRKAGPRYFYLRNSGRQNQFALFVRQGLKGPARALLDPNSWSTDGSIALDAWVPSRSGRWLAFSQQTSGSDWRTIRVVDVQTGVVLADQLDWANETQIGWIADDGFLYTRFPPPAAGEAFRAPSFNKAIWFHRVGTPQSADELVYATPAQPGRSHRIAVSSDGRWGIITSEESTAPRRAVRLIDLKARKPGVWPVIPLIEPIADDWKFVDGIGNRLWFITNSGAPRYKLVRLDMGQMPRWRDIVAQRDVMLDGGRVVGDRLVLSYLRDGSSVGVLTDLAGRPSRAITITGIGAASGFGGRPGDPETFYQLASFNLPPTIYRLDLRSGVATTFAVPRLPFNPADYVVEQRTFASKDGTQVPIYIMRLRALTAANKAAPTLLYGYGGFDVSLIPGYSALRMAWVQAGGAFALANIRGGGEFGAAWHDAGRLANKQNSFDDFIAAGEFLIANGITTKDGLAIQGSSNGGLLVGAVVNQRPDLFAAANPDVGVMDMLRFDRFTSGRFWVNDYGNPAREADWRVLRAYSPYHNIRAGAAYPAILVTTADTDDRVVPAHSFKYLAALQAAAIGDKPHLLRMERGAGHGSGRGSDRVISIGADVLAFLARWSGLKLAP